MKVFAYRNPPLNGRYLVGWAYILDGPLARFRHGADGLTDSSAYHITPMTLANGRSTVTERVILLEEGQSPEGLPAYRPEEAL